MVEKIGIIGGSGFYSLADDSINLERKTPFGKTTLEKFDIDGKEIFFLPRHGTSHSVPPHLINYKANIYALFSLGVTHIFSSSAVGSLHNKIAIGSFVIPDQFIDFTINRPKTFFDGKFSVKLHSGETKKGVIHTDFTTPYCSELREYLIKEAQKLDFPLHKRAVYTCMEGPRFETPAEINYIRKIGGEIVGMTSTSECILAKELELCYATICIVTNYAAGMQDKITMKEVLKAFKEKIDQIHQLMMSVIKEI